MAIDDLHDDEIKARLGIELGDDMEHRIEAHMVRAMPEEFDPDTEVDLELVDMTTMTSRPATCPLGCWRDCPRDCACECHREGRNR